MTDEKFIPETGWNKPHPFISLTEDMCKCFRWKDDPIHIGGVKVEPIRPEPVLTGGGRRPLCPTPSEVA